MNGESDKPASVLIGSPDDASELPPLQLARSSGSAKEPTQIPSAQILMRELDASNGMNPSYQERAFEPQGRPCSIWIMRTPGIPARAAARQRPKYSLTVSCAGCCR